MGILDFFFGSSKTPDGKCCRCGADAIRHSQLVETFSGDGHRRPEYELEFYYDPYCSTRCENASHEEYVESQPSWKQDILREIECLESQLEHDDSLTFTAHEACGLSPGERCDIIERIRQLKKKI